MGYALVMCTYRGEVLAFPVYTGTEYLLAVAIAREQSRRCSWAEVRDGDGSTRVRYRNGNLDAAGPPGQWRDDQLSYRRQLTVPPLHLREERGEEDEEW